MKIVPMTALRPAAQYLDSEQCAPRRACEPGGIMVHFDDSSEDRWAVAWFKDPLCKVSYNRLYLDDGATVQITPSMEQAAYHAGVCRTKLANSFFYGLAIATNVRVPVKPPQLEALTDDAVRIFRHHGWPAGDVTRRIRGHDEEACFKDGRLGRKIDPTGLDPAHPILDVRALRETVVARLRAA